MIIPSSLQKGDTIGITSTARKIYLNELVFTIEFLEHKGFKVKMGSCIGLKDHQFAGTENERTTSINELIEDNSVKAILCARGGYGSVRIVDHINWNAFQEAPITSVMGSVAKHVFLVTDEEKLEATMRAAFEIATSGRPGPVVVDVPKDIQTAIIQPDANKKLNISSYRERLIAIEQNTLSQDDCKRFFDLLENSKRPLFYAGGGTIAGDACGELRQFSNEFHLSILSRAPVVC